MTITCNFIYVDQLIICLSHLVVDIAYIHSLNIETGRYYNIDRHAKICNMCNNNVIEDEYHFILECSKYVEIRRKYIKPYYCINPSACKLTQLLSIQNIKELNNLGKYLYVAEQIRNS